MTTDTEVVPQTGADPRPRADVLRLADGVELMGQAKGSGYRKPPHLVRRADGQVVQLTKLLYAVAALSDGRRDARTVAEILTHASNRRFAADDVLMLVDKRLRPVGVLARADGTSPTLPKRQALMALRHRRPLLPARAVKVLAWPFQWLHHPVITVTVLLVLLGFDAWLFLVHGVGGPLRSALYHPELLLAVLGSVVVATAFHEIGHASACLYSGARPGAMGVGFYLVYPAFYCDVTDAYCLDRAGRLRTDLGGVYFNGIFALLAGVVYLATGQEAALLAAVLQHFVLLQQLLPLMRFDGYYVLTDLTGVPDILSRIRPIFRSLVRGRAHEPRVAELKPWVRVAVTTYLLALVPALLLLFAAMVLSAPRILATVQDSLGRQLEGFRAAAGYAETGVAAVGVLALLLPVAAMGLSIWCVARLLGHGLAGLSRGSHWRRGAAIMVGAALVGAVAYSWWPDGDYEPIGPDDEGTFVELVTKVRGDELVPLLGRDADPVAPQPHPPADTGTRPPGVGGEMPGRRTQGGAGTVTPTEPSSAGNDPDEPVDIGPSSAPDPTTSSPSGATTAPASSEAPSAPASPAPSTATEPSTSGEPPAFTTEAPPTGTAPPPSSPETASQDTTTPDSTAPDTTTQDTTTPDTTTQDTTTQDVTPSTTP